MGKVHGSLARAGKVKRQTPKVAKKDRDGMKKKVGRALKRFKHNRRFLTRYNPPGVRFQFNPQNVGLK